MDAGQIKQQARQHLQQGETAVALDLLATLSERFPNDAEGLALLGIVMTMTGRHADAELRFRAALALQPAAYSVHNNLGNALKALGRLADAEISYRTALKIRPDYVHASSNLGALLTETGRLEEAQAWLQRATVQSPNFTDAWNHLGNLFSVQQDLPAAETCYRRALALSPHLVDSRCNLADLLLIDRRIREAEVLYREGLAGMPDDVSLRGGLARLLERKGEFAEAQRLLADLAQEELLHPRVLLARSALAEYADAGDKVIRDLESALEQPLADRQRMDLHFELGRLYDRAGIFDRAFHHYSAGNDLDHSCFDADATADEFRRIKTVFGRGTLVNTVGSGVSSELPVFIVGMPRSGTSLVEQIVASHPDVYGAGELDALDDLVAGLPARLRSGRPYPDCLDDAADPAALQSMALDHIEFLHGLAPEATRISDKMPHNFRHLGLIATLFPRGRIVHCRRDPRDTCLSIYFTQFNANHPYAHDLGDLARYYALYADLMKYWEAVLRVPMLTIDYENLVANQEATVRKIIAFLDLPWDDRCLKFHTSRRIVDTPSYQQVRKPIYDRSVRRWKNYQGFIAPYFDTTT